VLQVTQEPKVLVELQGLKVLVELQVTQVPKVLVVLQGLKVL
jgi:hypothetical protein